jgi:parallel beta-helix repeat protein
LPIFAAIIILLIIPLSPLPIANAAKITVPSDFPTIQAAIDAASEGDTINVLAGTYTEQIIITKGLTITGSGAKSTIIKAPDILNPSPFLPFPGRANIVDIFNAAKVNMKGFTIAGPDGSTCPGLAGIRVIDDASLNLDSSTIKGCTREGMLVGFNQFIPNGPQVGHATITNTDITEYRFVGIQTGGPNTTIKLLKSSVVAANAPEVDGQIGIVFAFGAKGTITQSKVSGNICNHPDCGPDFFNQVQGVAILAVAAASGSSISHSEISNNDIGIAVAGNSGCCKITNNKLKDNRFFGITIVDGNHASSHDKISGGNVGVASIAIDADTTATLVHDKITDTTTPTQELECCGFTAEIVTIPSNSFQSSQLKSSQVSEVDPDFIKKKFGVEEDTTTGTLSSAAVSPF